MKRENEKLIQIADDALNSNENIWHNSGYKTILDGYNGQIASLSVSIAMIGLLPTLATYYQDNPDATPRDRVNRRIILDVIAQMLKEVNEEYLEFRDSTTMMKYAIAHAADINALKRDTVRCAVALKQVVRTYKLVEGND